MKTLAIIALTLLSLVTGCYSEVIQADPSSEQPAASAAPSAAKPPFEVRAAVLQGLVADAGADQTFHCWTYDTCGNGVRGFTCEEGYTPKAEAKCVRGAQGEQTDPVWCCSGPVSVQP